MVSWITDGFDYILYNFIYRLFYIIEILFCTGLKWLQSLFDVFVGTKTARIGQSENFLINIFFGDASIKGVYWGMAAIGIVLAFIFAIIAVVRKMFDIGEKMKGSLGQILGNLLKSILLIIMLNVGMTVIITSINVLMQSVVYVFDHAPELGEGDSHIEYTNEQFAAMARIFNTIGNYSLNPSYKNRYNLNACYNEIRGDLAYLADTKVFNYYYETEDENGNIVPTWQSVLQELANAADYTQEVPIDVYNEGIANALTDCMTLLKTDNAMEALPFYDRQTVYDSDDVGLDRIIFMIGTMGNGFTAAARNDTYNQNPSLLDPVRAPYYRGVKSIYDFDQVNKDFDIALTKTNYFVVYVAGVGLVGNMALILVSCVLRIFNLLLLYIVAPPLFAVMPLDDGGKVKQWTTAFIVQAFSVFATVISMRLYLIFVPVIMDPALKLTDNIVVDVIGRLILLYAGVKAVSKANGLVTGILADSAGYQSIMAGDMSDYLRNSTMGQIGAKVTGAIGSIPGKAIGLAGSTAIGAGKLVGKGVLGAGKLVGRGAMAGVRGLGRLMGIGGGPGGGGGGGDDDGGGDVPLPNKSELFGGGPGGGGPNGGDDGGDGPGGGHDDNNRLNNLLGGNGQEPDAVPPPQRDIQ